jgi:acetylornithine deacetylase
VSALTESDVLALHRMLVSTPSVSGSEQEIADRMAGFLAERGLPVTRLGNSVLALHGSGPLLLLDSHLDTVPPGPGWSTAPFAATVIGDRVLGLGANDAKASVAAMTAAFLDAAGESLGITLGLALVASEETTAQGTQDVLEHLAREGHAVEAAVFGEPTELQLAVAQKGLLVLELVARGTTRHAGHPRARGETSAVRLLARDLRELDDVDLAPDDPRLGRATLEPTVVRAGAARNVVPSEATATVDGRTTPALPPEEIVTRLRAVLSSEVRVVSDRLGPRATPESCTLLRAARVARPGAREYGSPTLSDWALLPAATPALKVGPGSSARSHKPDEFVHEREVLEGAQFYARLVRAFAAGMMA